MYIDTRHTITRIIPIIQVSNGESHDQDKVFMEINSYKIALIVFPIEVPIMNVQILDIFLWLLFLHKKIYEFSICVNVFIKR